MVHPFCPPPINCHEIKNPDEKFKFSHQGSLTVSGSELKFNNHASSTYNKCNYNSTGKIRIVNRFPYFY